MTIGRLTYLREAEPNRFDKLPKRRSVWRCECGREKVISHSSVITGRTRSCGCVQPKIWNGYVSSAVNEARAKARGR